MTLWLIVIAASLACLALKLAGYYAPRSFLDRPRPTRIANLLTVALLAALIGVQTLGQAREVVLDARVPALIVAAGLLAVRVPFILVVIAAAATAAVVRAIW